MLVRSILKGAALALALCGCEAAEPSGKAEGVAEQAMVVQDFEVLLPWGDTAAGGVGHRPRAPEFAGDGPSGIAVSPSGTVLVSDRLHGVLLEVGPGGARPMFPIAEDVEHVAVGEDGAVALYSPLRAKAWLHAAGGDSLGELRVSRQLGDVVRLSLAPSQRIVVHTALQERFTVGSPHAPLSEAEVFRSKEEGAALGWVSIRPASGPAYLAEVGPSASGRTEERRRIDLGAELSSARILGRTGAHLVLDVTRVTQPSAAVEVERQLWVVDVVGGRVTAEMEGPRRGLWTPREAVAVGPASIAWMTAEHEGLRVVRRGLTQRGGRE